jgi:hypothetical protein
VVQALETILFLLNPPLDAEAHSIQELHMQDDHLVVVEEEEANAIVK